MSRSLNPQVICNLYTLEEIKAKIDTYNEALEKAVTEYYDFDSTQSRQKVQSAQMDKIESVLSVYMKALACKKGVSGTRIVSANFGGHR